MTLYLGGKAVSVNSMVTTEKEKTKLGLTIDNFIGNLSDDGVLTSPKSIGNTLDFSGVVEWKADMRSGFYAKPIKNILFPDLKHLSGGSMYSMFEQNTAIQTVSFPALVSISATSACEYMFKQCSHLESLYFPELQEVLAGRPCPSMCQYCYELHTFSAPKLKTIGPYWEAGQFQYTFSNNTKLTNVDLTSLEKIEGYFACSGMFSGCSKLETILLPSLKTVGNLSSMGGECNTMFTSCSSLSTVDLSGLETILGKNACQGMFQYCKSLTSISFPSLTRIEGTTPMNSMFSGCTNLLEIHFRADMQTTVEALSEYSNKFGATNATIYFDL
jgi:hypothetical protein